MYNPSISVWGTMAQIRGKQTSTFRFKSAREDGADASGPWRASVTVGGLFRSCCMLGCTWALRRHERIPCRGRWVHAGRRERKRRVPPGSPAERKPCPLTLSVSFKHFIGCVKHLSLWGLWKEGGREGDRWTDRSAIYLPLPWKHSSMSQYVLGLFYPFHLKKNI